MDKVQYYFYILRDPTDMLLKYVGRTVNPKSRLRSHIYEAKTNNRNKRERWIMSLIKKNKLPELNVIYEKECCIEEAIQIEKMLVRKIGKKFELKNSPDNFLGAVLTGTPVHQYNITNCNYIATYANANQASIKTGIHDANIGRCCKDDIDSQSAGGYIWSYNKYDTYPKKYNKNWGCWANKSVIQIKDGEIIAEFVSAREANTVTGVCYKQISSVCNHKRKVAGGYSWEFKQNNP